MNRRFTDHELYVLRNEIPIQLLIESKLKIPSKMQEGIFRFLSPCCGEFNTGVKKETNLARCFCCDKDFNTIDMVIAVKKYDFVNSVRFLQQIHSELSCHLLNRKIPQPSIHLGLEKHPTSRKKCLEPVHLKDILNDMTASGVFEGSENLDNNSFNPKEQIIARLSKLEKETTQLAKQIDQIKIFLKNFSK